MTPSRRTALIEAACQQLIYPLECDRDGDEQLMKEFWEECRDQEEIAIGKAVLDRVIEFLGGLAARGTLDSP